MKPAGAALARWSGRLLHVALSAGLVASGAAIACGRIGPLRQVEQVSLPAPLPVRPFTSPLDPAVEPVPPIRLGERPSDAGAPAIRGCDGPIRAREIVVPDLCIQAPVVATERPTGRALRIPSDVHEVGWWDGSAPVTGPDGRVGGSGTTLLVGHVSVAGQGRGSLYPLASAAPGTAVYVSDAEGRVTRWRITSLQAMPKDELPPDLFDGEEGPRRLAMVTCGGPVETVDGHRSFRDNVVAIARPDPSEPT